MKNPFSENFAVVPKEFFSVAILRIHIFSFFVDISTRKKNIWRTKKYFFKARYNKFYIFKNSFRITTFFVFWICKCHITKDSMIFQKVTKFNIFQCVKKFWICVKKEFLNIIILMTEMCECKQIVIFIYCCFMKEYLDIPIEFILKKILHIFISHSTL